MLAVHGFDLNPWDFYDIILKVVHIDFHFERKGRKNVVTVSKTQA